MTRCLFAAAAALLLGAHAASADEIFDYTGNDYTHCLNVAGCTADRMSGTFAVSLSGSALDNLSGFVVPISDLLSFSFSDGFGHSVNQSTPNLTEALVEIWTDPVGKLTAWDIVFIMGNNQFGIGTQNFTSGYSDDTSYCNFSCGQYAEWDGYEQYNPGNWTQVATDVPEPASLALFGTGLVGFVAVRRRRRKTEQPSKVLRYCGFSRLNMADSSS